MPMARGDDLQLACLLSSSEIQVFVKNQSLPFNLSVNWKPQPPSFSGLKILQPKMNRRPASKPHDSGKIDRNEAPRERLSQSWASEWQEGWTDTILNLASYQRSFFFLPECKNWKFKSIRKNLIFSKVQVTREKSWKTLVDLQKDSYDSSLNSFRAPFYQLNEYIFNLSPMYLEREEDTNNTLYPHFSWGRGLLNVCNPRFRRYWLMLYLQETI